MTRLRRRRRQNGVVLDVVIGAFDLCASDEEIVVHLPLLVDLAYLYGGEEGKME